MNPRTPGAVKASFVPEIYTIPVGKTRPEIERLNKVEALLRGNATSGKHDADAHHLFEAAKYGGGYFITNDQRILRKCSEIRDILSPALNIVTVAEFLDIYDQFNP
jgi:hypothetical protein